MDIKELEYILQRKRLRIAQLCGKMILKLLSMRTIYEKSNPNAIF